MLKDLWDTPWGEGIKEGNTGIDTHPPSTTLKNESSASRVCCLECATKIGKLCILPSSLYVSIKKNYQILGFLEVQDYFYTSLYFPWCLTQCLAHNRCSIHIFVSPITNSIYTSWDAQYRKPRTGKF